MIISQTNNSNHNAAPSFVIDGNRLLTNLFNSALTIGAFGVFAGIAALQFFSEVPKVRKDILSVSCPSRPREDGFDCTPLGFTLEPS